MSKHTREIAVVATVVIAAAAALVHYATGYLGFPDGHLTEPDRALKPLARVFAGVSTLMALWCGYWASRSQPQYKAQVLRCATACSCCWCWLCVRI